MARPFTLVALLALLILPLHTEGRPAPRRRAEDEEFLVIVNPRSPLQKVSRSELSSIFLKRSDKWADGTPARPCDLSSTSPVRKAFSESVHGRSLFVVMSYWQQEIAAGRSSPPAVCATEAAAVQWVRENPGAVAYLSSGTALTDVKVLAIEP